jgi:predicted lipoprotein with Yx(FWY)xxD motif
MRTTGKRAKTINKFTLSAAAIAAALAVSACGSSGSSATTSSLTLGHAPLNKASRDTRPRAAPRPTGPVIKVRSSQYGRILADRGDRTIYLFTRDRSAASTCSGACAAVWPPVLTRGVPGRAGRLPGALATTLRRDGARQVTHDGHPLYYYTGDVSPGQILCQNVNEFGGTWLVVSPSGQPVH